MVEHLLLRGQKMRREA